MDLPCSLVNRESAVPFRNHFLTQLREIEETLRALLGVVQLLELLLEIIDRFVPIAVATQALPEVGRKLHRGSASPVLDRA